MIPTEKTRCVLFLYSFKRSIGAMSIGPPISSSSEDRAEGGVDNPGQVGYVFGLVSYEIVLLVIGIVTLIANMLPIIIDDDRSGLSFSYVGVKAFLVCFAVVDAAQWRGAQTITHWNRFVIPSIIVECFLCILADNLRIAYSYTVDK
nr:unnamed protein product [Haemonchus contortus]